MLNQEQGTVPEAVVDQTISLQLVKDRIAHLEPQLGKDMLALLTGDRSQEKGYKMSTKESEWIPGLTFVTEEVEGRWTRVTSFYGQNYERTPGVQVVEAGTVIQRYEERDMEKRWGPLLVVDTTVSPEGALEQKLQAVPYRLVEDPLTRGTLIEGERTFFGQIFSGPVEKRPTDWCVRRLSVEPDGTKNSYLFARGATWLGKPPHRNVGHNQVSLVVSKNGVVEYGSVMVPEWRSLDSVRPKLERVN